MDDVYKQVFTESEKLIKYLFDKSPKTEFSKDKILQDDMEKHGMVPEWNWKLLKKRSVRRETITLAKELTKKRN